MAMVEFQTPAFLENRDVETIHGEMLDIIPSDNDKSQGQHAWNYTRPTAMEMAYLCEMILPEAIRLIFPQYAYGEYLDLHAEALKIVRKKAQKAVGDIEVSGKPGTLIPIGSIFSTARVNNDPSIDFATVEEVEIPDSGAVSVPVEAVEAGPIGNVLPGTIIIKASKLDGVTGVTNQTGTSGGTVEESDESLLSRIESYNQSADYSFVGSPADYKRWAESVDGTGVATIIPAKDDTALVTIVLMDQNGEPASARLCETVYNYIMSPDDQEARLAPVGANLQVVPPDVIELQLAAVIELDGSLSIEGITKEFIRLVREYMPTAVNEREIKYTKLGAILARTPGVADHKDFTVNGDTVNIPIEENQTHTVNEKTVKLTAGDVV